MSAEGTGSTAEGSGRVPNADLYLELLKRALTHTLYWPIDATPLADYASEEMKAAVLELLEREGSLDFSTTRAEGRDWPKFAQTMVGRARLDNVHACIEQVVADDVPGDLIEAGVWRGGVTILMRGVLKAHGVADRRVFVADSFQGLPPPDAAAYPADAGDIHHQSALLAVSRADVERNFSQYDLLDAQVVFVEGWFRDTLPTLSKERWSVVRVDGDLYESTMDALTNLYPGLSPGGFVIIDDFAFDPCRQAVEDFRALHGIVDPIEKIDWTGVYWRRSTGPGAT
jgi:hypothetical protein